MRNPGGYGHWFNGDIGLSNVECDTFTCHHCDKVVFVEPAEPPENMGGVCKICMKLICEKCVGKGTCDPYEEKMQRTEARDRSRRSMGINPR